MALNTKNMKSTAVGQMEAGNHEGRIAAVVYLGKHEQYFEGKSTGVKDMVTVVIEAADEQDDAGNNKIISKEFAVSNHEKAFLMKLCAAALGPEPDTGYDLDKLLGKPIGFTIKHSAAGYAKIEAVSPLREAQKAKVKALDNPPYYWDGSDGTPYKDHDFIPWVFCDSLGKRVKVSEMIAASVEPAGAAAAAPV